ncbi:MAG: hypothetical protein PHV79_03105 [Clostridia bacterium]|nr:hypothetical protein [Clostridia bacterium]
MSLTGKKITDPNKIGVLKREFKKWNELGLQSAIFEEPSFQKIILPNVLIENVNFYENISDGEQFNGTTCCGKIRMITHTEIDRNFSFVLYTNASGNMQKIFLELLPDNPNHCFGTGELLNYSCLACTISPDKQFVEAECVLKNKPRELSYYITGEGLIAKDFIEEIQSNNYKKYLHHFVKRAPNNDTAFLIGKGETSRDIHLFELENQTNSDEILYEIIAKSQNKDYRIEAMKFKEIRDIIELDSKIKKFRTTHKNISKSFQDEGMNK